MREQRNAAAPQVRADLGGTVAVTGYASTIGTPYEVHDWLGTYTETIAPGAFDRALAEGQDVRLLVNHDGVALARTTSGTMRLSVDAHGLRVDAELDTASPLVQTIRSALDRGDMTQMSFAFVVTPGGQQWNDDYTERTITDLDLIDVSIVTYPANPATSVQAAA